MLALDRKHQEWIRPLLGREEIPCRLIHIAYEHFVGPIPQGNNFSSPPALTAIRIASIWGTGPPPIVASATIAPWVSRDRPTAEQRLPQWPPPDARKSRLRQDSCGRSCLECHRIARVRQATRRAHDAKRTAEMPFGEYRSHSEGRSLWRSRARTTP